ncbi:MAG: oligosaccharide flippase family protein [Rhizobacter sp.]
MASDAPPPAHTNREATARALVWTLLESFGLSGLSVVALVVLSRYVSPAEFGVASLALAVVQMATVIVERLFHDPLIQRRDLTARDSASAFSATVVLGILLMLSCWVAAPWLARTFGQPGMASLLYWMSTGILAASLSTVLIALHRREMAFRALAVRSLVARAVAALIAIVLAMWGAGVWSIVAQQVLTASLAAAALWWLSAVARPHLAWDGRALREMVVLGIPSTLQQFMWIANARLFLLLAGTQLNVVALGQIALAFRAVDMMRDLLAQAVSQLALPLFARVEREQGDRRRAFVSAVRLTSAVMLPVFTGLAVLAPEVIELAFGAQWLAAAPFVSLLALLTFHFFPRMFVTPLLSALGRPATTMVGSLVQALFIAAALWMATDPSPALVMAVWASRLLVSTPIDMWMLKRLAGIGYLDQWRGAFNPALASAVAAAAMTGMRLAGWLPASVLPRLMLSVMTGAALYGLTLWLIDRALLNEVRTVFAMAVSRGKSRPASSSGGDRP